MTDEININFGADPSGEGGAATPSKGQSSLEEGAKKLEGAADHLTRATADLQKVVDGAFEGTSSVKDVSAAIKELAAGQSIILKNRALDTKDGAHRYYSRGGEKIEVAIEELKIPKFSVTELVEKAFGGSNPVKQLAEIDSQIAALEAKKRRSKEEDAELKALRYERKDANTRAYAFQNAGKVGTAVHKILELSRSGRLGANLDKDSIEDLSKVITSLASEKDAAGHSTETAQALEYARSSEKALRDVIARSKEISKVLTRAGITGPIETEQSIGILTNINGRLIELNGTIDGLVKLQNKLALVDYKTNYTPPAEHFSAQGNILAWMLKQAGRDVSSIKMAHAARGKTGSLYDLDIMPDIEKYLGEMVSAALGETAPVQPRDVMHHQAMRRPYTTKTGERGEQWMIDDTSSLASAPKVFKGNVDKFVQIVTSMPLEMREALTRSIWMLKKDEDDEYTDEFYRSGSFWDEVRDKLPSFLGDLFTGRMSQKLRDFSNGVPNTHAYVKRSFVDDQGNVRDYTTFFGGSKRDWGVRSKNSEDDDNDNDAYQRPEFDQYLEAYIKAKGLDKARDADVSSPEYRQWIAWLARTEGDYFTGRNIVEQEFAKDWSAGRESRGINDLTPEEKRAQNERQDKQRHENENAEFSALIQSLAPGGIYDMSTLYDLRGQEQRLREVTGNSPAGQLGQQAIEMVHSIVDKAVETLMGTDDTLMSEELKDALTRFIALTQEFLKKARPATEEDEKAINKFSEYLAKANERANMGPASKRQDLSEEERRSIALKTGTQLAWLTEGVGLYENTFRDRMEAENAMLPDEAKYRNITEFLLSPGHLTEEQKKQYMDSLMAREIASQVDTEETREQLYGEVSAKYRTAKNIAQLREKLATNGVPASDLTVDRYIESQIADEIDTRVAEKIIQEIINKIGNFQSRVASTMAQRWEDMAGFDQEAVSTFRRFSRFGGGQGAIVPSWSKRQAGTHLKSGKPIFAFPQVETEYFDEATGQMVRNIPSPDMRWMLEEAEASSQQLTEGQQMALRDLDVTRVNLSTAEDKKRQFLARKTKQEEAPVEALVNKVSSISESAWPDFIEAADRMLSLIPRTAMTLADTGRGLDFKSDFWAGNFSGEEERNLGVAEEYSRIDASQEESIGYDEHGQKVVSSRRYTSAFPELSGQMEEYDEAADEFNRARRALFEAGREVGLSEDELDALGGLKVIELLRQRRDKAVASLQEGGGVYSKESARAQAALAFAQNMQLSPEEAAIKDAKKLEAQQQALEQRNAAKDQAEVDYQKKVEAYQEEKKKAAEEALKLAEETSKIEGETQKQETGAKTEQTKEEEPPKKRKPKKQKPKEEKETEQQEKERKEKEKAKKKAAKEAVKKAAEEAERQRLAEEEAKKKAEEVKKVEEPPKKQKRAPKKTSSKKGSSQSDKPQDEEKKPEIEKKTRTRKTAPKTQEEPAKKTGRGKSVSIGKEATVNITNATFGTMSGSKEVHFSNITAQTINTFNRATINSATFGTVPNVTIQNLTTDALTITSANIQTVNGGKSGGGGGGRKGGGRGGNGGGGGGEPPRKPPGEIVPSEGPPETPAFVDTNKVLELVNEYYKTSLARERIRTKLRGEVASGPVEGETGPTFGPKDDNAGSLRDQEAKLATELSRLEAELKNMMAGLSPAGLSAVTSRMDILGMRHENEVNVMAAKDEQKRNADKQNYISLLREEYKLREQIWELQQRQEALDKKGADTQAISSEIDGLYEALRLNEEFQKEINQDFNPKDKEHIGKVQEGLERQYGEKGTERAKFQSTFGTAMASETEGEYKKLLDQRLALEKQGMSAQHKLMLSYNTQEKGAYQDVINITKQQLAQLDAKLVILKNSDLMRRDEVAALEAAYKVQNKLNRAEQAGQKGGAVSVWDMMRNDMSRAMARVFDYGVAMRALNSIPQAFRKIYDLTVQLDSALTNLRIVTGENEAGAQKLIITYNKLGKELGATTQQIAESANEWLRQGYSAQEAGDLIDASMKLSKLGMIESSEATQYLTSMLKGFKMEAENALEVVDKLTNVDIEAAVSAGGIAEALSRTATSAQLAGLSLDESIGMVTVIGEVTQKSMESVGESVKTLLSRYGNVKAGVFTQMGLDDDGETTDNINDIEKVLGKLGIPIRSSNLEMRAISDVLDDLADKWQTLDTVSKNAVATAMAGVRQRENFNVLMENYARAEELAEKSADSAGTANEKYEAYADSIEAAMNRLTAAWEKLTTSISSSWIVKTGVKTLTFFVENLDKIAGLMMTIGTNILTRKLVSGQGGAGGGLFGKIWAGGQPLRMFNNAMFGERFGGKLNEKIGARLSARQERRTQEGKDTALYWDESNATEKAQKKIGGPFGTAATVIVDTLEKGFDKLAATMERNQEATDKNTAATEENTSATQQDATTTEQNTSATESETTATQQDTTATQTDTAVTQADTAVTQQDVAVTSQDVVATSQDVVATTTNTTAETSNTAATNSNSTAENNNTMATNANTASQNVDNVTDAAGNAGKAAGKLGKPLSLGAQSALTGLASGAMAGMTAAMSMNEVGGNNSWASSFINKTGQTVEADMADKAIAGVTEGAITGAFSAIPVVGSFLGPLMGELVGGPLSDLFTYLRHEDELKRKERVENAKKELEALGKVSETLTSMEGLMSTSDWGADQYKEAHEAADAFEDAMKKTTDAEEDFLAAVRANVEGFQNATADAIYAALYGTDEEAREAIWHEAELATARSEREQTEKAQEQERYELEAMKNQWTVAQLVANTDKGDLGTQDYKLRELMKDIDFGGAASYDNGTGKLTINGSTAKERYENAQITYQKLADAGAHQGVLDTLQTEIEKYKEAAEALDDLDEQLVEQDLNIGYFASGVSNLTQKELENMGVLGVVDEVAAALEAEGIAVRDSAGIIKDQYLTAIEAMMREDENMTELLKGQSNTVEEAFKKQEKLAGVLGQLAGTGYDSYDSLKLLFTQYSSANQAKAQELATSLGMTVEQLRNLVYTSDPDQVFELAQAFGITTDQLTEMRDIIGDLSLSDAMLSPSEVRDKYSSLSEIFSSALTSSPLTGEELETLIAEAPELVGKSMEEIRAALSKKLGEEQDWLYGQSLFGELYGSEDFFDEFVKQIDEGIYDGIDEATRNQLSEVSNFTQLESYVQSLSKDSPLRKAIEEYFTFDITVKANREQVEQVMEYQSRMLEDQIEALEEQKDAIGAVNEERKKELDLIKAEMALENAGKEKKKVWREGVGWTWVTDEEGVKEAQENLEEKQTEKRQDDVQLEIDRLQAQKDFLEAIPDREEIAQLKAVTDEWLESISKTTDANRQILSLIESEYNKDTTYSGSDYISGKMESLDEGKEKANEKLMETWEALEAANKKVTNATNRVDYANAVKEYNQALTMYQTAAQEAKNVGITEPFKSNAAMETALTREQMNYTDKDFGAAVVDLGVTATGTQGLLQWASNIKANPLNGLMGFHLDGGTFSESIYTQEDMLGQEDGKGGGIRGMRYQGKDVNGSMLYYVPDADGNYRNAQQKKWNWESGTNPDEKEYQRILGASGQDAANDYAVEAIRDWFLSLPTYTVVDPWGNGTGMFYITPERTFGQFTAAASGSLSMPGGASLINEEGTEALITPQGTLTALPAKTGVLPADITENLWKLGGIAPSLISTLSSLTSSPYSSSNAGSTVNNSGTFIDNLSMQIYPTKDYDMDKFLEEARAKARLSRNNN